MTVLATPQEQTRISRPGSVKALTAVLTFLGITALGGGIEMLAFYEGNEYLPTDMLDEIPFDTFIVPGLVLGGIFGIGSLVLAWGIWRRAEIRWLRWIETRTGRLWSWMGSVVMGIGFASWMVIEISLLGAPWEQADASGEGMTWVLYGIYVAVALALLSLPHVEAVKRYLRLGRGTG